MPPNPPFSLLLRTARDRAGLTQAEAAEVCEVSKSAIEKWEAGTKEPLPPMQEGVLARLINHPRQKPVGGGRKTKGMKS